MKTLTVAIIIPVYNEEYHIRRCLDAIARQVVKPDEVLIVDNNCTDNTVSIAKSYPFVTIVRERKQGLIAARNRGFNSAKSDILARIDVDAEINPLWVKQLKQNFKEDETLSGITGPARTSILPRLKKPHSTFFSRGYFWGVSTVFHTQVLWGANMAIRSKMWQQIKGITCPDDHVVHEDQDLSMCILSRGGYIKLDPQLLMTTNGQTYHYFPKLVEYIRRCSTTYKWHEQHNRAPVREEVRIKPIKYVLASLGVYTIGLLFLGVSFLFWPLDLLMVKVGHAKKWLD